MKGSNDNHRDAMWKLKRKVQQFLNQDQQLWDSKILSLSCKFDTFISEIKTLKEQFVVDKKMKYAFDWNHNLASNAKDIINGNHEKLKKSDIEEMKEVVSKPRNIDQKKVQMLISSLDSEAQRRIIQLLQDAFDSNTSYVLSTKKQKVENSEQSYQEQSEFIAQKKQKKQNNSQITKTESQAKETHRQGFSNLSLLTIKDVLKLNQRTSFDIFLQIVQIKNTFNIENIPFVRVTVKDKTGYMEAVFRQLIIIKVGKSIKVTNAKVYEFRGTKQIQMNKVGTWIQELDEDGKVVTQNRRTKNNPRTRQRQTQGFKRGQRQHQGFRRGTTRLSQENLEHSKISDIQPGAQGLNLLVEVIEVLKQSQAIKEKGMLICHIADDTAMVRAKLSIDYPFIKVGTVLHIKNADAQVDKDNRITIKLQQSGDCQPIRAKIPRINTTQKMSIAQWQVQDQQKSQQKSKQIGKEPAAKGSSANTKQAKVQDEDEFW